MSKKGFTLVELLIVIAIIGVLAAALLIGLNPIEQMRKARDGGNISRAKEVISAAERALALDPTASITCGNLVTLGELKDSAICTVGDPTCSGAGVCTVNVAVKSKYYSTCCGGSPCTVPTNLTKCAAL